MGRRALLLVATAVGCGSGAPPAGEGLSLPSEPVTVLVGEVHLHQFPLGSHAWAAFVADPVPLAQVHDDQLVELTTVPSAVEGTCTLWRRTICDPDCPRQSYCVDNDVCTPVPPITYVDGGPIRVTGSLLHPTIRLDFTVASTSYASDPPPGSALLFAGGELLHLEGGSGPDQLDGVVSAPSPLLVAQPDLAAPFHLPQSGALDVRWEAGTAALVAIFVNASRSDGDYASIRCIGPDGGQARVPAGLLAGLPPPPRDIRIEIERDNELLIKTVTPGKGVLVHAAFSAWANGSD